ncbi:MAG: hydrogenase nickel incorporation protein HypB [Bryobacteraceae bacterium]|nr:hydrogenase nickel incorporation protein HypB [Bryobacteraceae bacterium]
MPLLRGDKPGRRRGRRTRAGLPGTGGNVSGITTEPVGRKVLHENEKLAAGLRRQFAERGVLCLNLISAPGSGKTALLEKTLAALPAGSQVAVLTGDIQTDNDARRLARYGFPVRQITTAGTCHLDAAMVRRELDAFDAGSIDLLLIENVGNLVCPTSYDLGEAAKIVVLSVTEGDDKPLKYPGIFRKSELMILSKIDLLPYVPFDPAAAFANARRVNPQIEVLELSSLTGAGFNEWMRWLERRRSRQ